LPTSQISKQEKLSHVVLVTSEYSVVDWLTREVGDAFFTTHEIGNFAEKGAREFFNHALKATTNKDMKIDDKDWREVFQVTYAPCVAVPAGLALSSLLRAFTQGCGGNAGLLEKVAVMYETTWFDGESPVACVLAVHLLHLDAFFTCSRDRGDVPRASTCA
jgi:hypothetical protein